MKVIALEKCIHNKIFRNKGEVIEVEGDVIPQHFAKIDKDGKIVENAKPEEVVLSSDAF